jgi:hypothetical protein
VDELRYNVEITSSCRCVRLKSHSRLHWSSIGPLRRLREVDIAPRMPDKTSSSPTLRNKADPEYYHGKTFSPLAPSGSHTYRCQTPLSLMRMRLPEHASCVGSHLQISLLLFILRHSRNWPLDSAVGLSVAPGPYRDSSAGLLFG